jgi:hypothetical protein
MLTQSFIIVGCCGEDVLGSNDEIFRGSESLAAATKLLSRQLLKARNVVLVAGRVHFRVLQELLWSALGDRKVRLVHRVQCERNTFSADEEVAFTEIMVPASVMFAQRFTTIQDTCIRIHCSFVAGQAWQELGSKRHLRRYGTIGLVLGCVEKFE